MYERSCELIYKMISARFRIKKDFLKKAYKDIYDGEESLLCAIAQNRRHEKKNKYLIPAKTSRSAEPKEYAQKIATALEFDSVASLLWGDLEEIESYSGELFYLLIKDALDCESPETVDKINTILKEYIPYAISSFAADFVEHVGDRDITHFLIESELISDYEDMAIQRDDAISRLFYKVKDLFIPSIHNYFSKLGSTKKLDKKFSFYVRNNLLPLIEQELTHLSIGYEVNQILLHWHNRFAYLFNSDLTSSFRSIPYHINDKELYDDQIAKNVIDATIKYAKNLAAIQDEADDWREIENSWGPEMCI